MKKILVIILLTFTTFAAADEGKYIMIPADGSNARVWVFNTENGDIKQCYFQGGARVMCTSWRKNDEDNIYKD